MFSTIFPDVPVKLDLFHAVQRFTKALSHDVRLRSGIAKEYGLIFRHPHDLGEKRVSPTPDTDTILQNLAGFQRKWSQQTFNGLPVISPAAQKAIDNIQVHIQKGCTSCIPSHCSTSRNERLHRELNHILSTNRIGLELAFLRCSRIFFRMNNPFVAQVKTQLLKHQESNIFGYRRLFPFKMLTQQF